MKEMSINESVGFKKRFSTISKEYAILFAIIGLGLVFSLSTEYFLTQKNITNILLQSTALSIVAAGQGMVILSGEFDLSLGQVACLTSCTAAYMMKMMFINPWLAIAVALLLGMGLGAANGVMVAYFKMPAFIATLGIQNIARGFSKVITNAAPIANLPEEISVFGRQSIGFVPVSVILMVAVFAIFIFVTTKTKYGRYVYSVGGNKEAAYFAGINVKLIKMSVYVVSGLLAAFGGIVLMSRLDSASITNANLYEFDSIIASVIGGLSLTGGKGKIVGAALGSIFLIMFFNGMTLLNVDPFYQDVLKGVVLIAAIGIDVMRNRSSLKG